MTTAFESMLDAAEAIVKERSARYIVAEKTIAQVTKPYGDQLANAVYDVWNGNSDAIDLRRAHKALLREFAFQAYDEGLREGGIPESEMDDEDKAARGEAVFDWLANQLEYVNDFAKAVGEARKDKAKRPAILDRVSMWVDSMRTIGEQGRAYALRNVKAKWYLGDRQNHTPDCVDLSKKAAHRVSWWIERGYTPPIHLGCGCRLADVKNGKTIMGE